MIFGCIVMIEFQAPSYGTEAGQGNKEFMEMHLGDFGYSQCE